MLGYEPKGPGGDGGPPLTPPGLLPDGLGKVARGVGGRMLSRDGDAAGEDALDEIAGRPPLTEVELRRVMPAVLALGAAPGELMVIGIATATGWWEPWEATSMGPLTLLELRELGTPAAGDIAAAAGSLGGGRLIEEVVWRMEVAADSWLPSIVRREVLLDRNYVVRACWRSAGLLLEACVHLLRLMWVFKC